MQILCCYANLNPTTAITIAEFAPETQLIDVYDRPNNYWLEIAKRWTGEDDLMTVEQDMVLTNKIVQSLQDCPEPWCLYEYPGPPGKGILKYSLGCTRFRKEFQQKFPRQAFVPDGKFIDWIHVDVRISYVLNNENGIEPHIHGSIEHLHNYESECPVYEEAMRNNKLDRLTEGKDDINTFVRHLATLCDKVVYISDDPESAETGNMAKLGGLDDMVLNVEYLKIMGRFVPETEIRED